jgi:hypothetical protein
MGRKAYGHFGGHKATCLPLPGNRTTIAITKIVFISLTQLLLLYSKYYSGDMFRLY